jgi:hypothetical protein
MACCSGNVLWGAVRTGSVEGFLEEVGGPRPEKQPLVQGMLDDRCVANIIVTAPPPTSTAPTSPPSTAPDGLIPPPAQARATRRNPPSALETQTAAPSATETTRASFIPSTYPDETYGINPAAVTKEVISEPGARKVCSYINYTDFSHYAGELLSRWIYSWTMDMRCQVPSLHRRSFRRERRRSQPTLHSLWRWIWYVLWVIPLIT